MMTTPNDLVVLYMVHDLPRIEMRLTALVSQILLLNIGVTCFLPVLRNLA